MMLLTMRNGRGIEENEKSDNTEEEQNTPTLEEYEEAEAITSVRRGKEAEPDDICKEKIKHGGN